MTVPLNMKWMLFNELNKKIVKNNIINGIYSQYKTLILGKKMKIIEKRISKLTLKEKFEEKRDLFVHFNSKFGLEIQNEIEISCF